MITTFPNASPETLFELASNTETRKTWDVRWNEVSPLDSAQAHGGDAMHIIMKKPSVPMVSTRDIVCAFWKDDSAFEGKKC